MLIGAIDKKVWVFKGATDMRKSYEGLYALTRSSGYNIFDGDLFLFISGNRKRAKVLFWDGSGLSILMKRMEKHVFCKLLDHNEMSVSELNLFMQGARLSSQIVIPEKKRYSA
jgi:transposase